MTTPPSTATPRTDDGLLAVALACEYVKESVTLAGTDMKEHGADIRRVLAELARLRTELERADVLYHRSCEIEHALRAEVERLKGALALGQENCDSIYNDMREERTELTARAERAEAALAEWSVLNLWGGTPEIIHEFIKGQQNRIHHCQDLEAELAEAVDGEINGGSIPDTLLVIHVPRSPVGYRVGQPVKVILPAIDAAMKGTT